MNRAVVPPFVGIAMIALLTVAPTLADHDKTDVVKLDDGNSYIGEVKSVEYATLNFDMDAAGTVAVEWRRVTALTSKFDYRVETTGGDLHFGSLAPAEEQGHISIVGPDGTETVALADIVGIAPIEHGFWKRLDGSVNFGFSYTQANRAIQYNLSGDATYLTRKTLAKLKGQSIFNTQTGGETTNQHNLDLTLVQITQKKWNAFEVAQLQSNPDQGFDLRGILGGGATRFFVKRSNTLFAFNAGAVYNVEAVVDSSETDQSAEVMLGIVFHRFKRGSHSPDVQLTWMTFTNVTDTPRFRTILNFQVGWKIVGDFIFNFQIRNSYDSDPPTADAENNDMTVVTAIGYAF